MGRLLGICALLAGLTAAAQLVMAADGLGPVIPKAQKRFSPTQGCVEPTDEMRRNHMKYILHERDETVHEGIRGSRHSLKVCINCHVPPQTGNKKVRVESKEHFCNSCHTFAAVYIDCFQCHSDQPAPMNQRNEFPHRETGSIAPDQRRFMPSLDHLSSLAIEDSQP